MKLFQRHAKSEGPEYALLKRDLGLNEEDPREVEFFGNTVLRDDENWHFCIIFPLLDQESKEPAEWECVIPAEDVRRRLGRCFRPCVLENENGEFNYLQIEDTFSQDMTVGDFYEAMRFVIASFLAGHHMGMKLESSPSIDLDELFLKVELTEGKKVDLEHTASWMPHLLAKRYNTHQQLADAVHLRMPLEPGQYPRDLNCPTTSLDNRRNFQGTDYVPAALAFSKGRASYFKPFSEMDLIRLCRLRMHQFLDFHQLTNEGIVKSVFAVHRWRRVSMFGMSRGWDGKDAGANSWPHAWSRLSAIAQWPGDQHLSYVKDYFGEEVAFSFHWLNFFTRHLILPAVGGLLTILLRCLPFFQIPNNLMYLEITFMVLAILWASTFGEIYDRRMQAYVESWGMRDYQHSESERPSFRKELIGTFKEEIRQILHWCGIVVVVLWTVGFNYCLSKHRADMLQNPQQIFWFGQPGEVCEKYAKYITTINIQVVDAIWFQISPRLSRMENHRTSLELRDAIVLKLIVVKVFVYNWPFWYIAFVQRHMEGCDIGGTTCLEYLEQSLLVFVVLHIVYVIWVALLSVCQTRFSIWRELRSAGERQYTYLEAQAKCPEYGAEVEIADFLELITSLGLVMQFTIILPIIPFLQLLSNLVELRINAYRMANVYRRVPARGSEGIGSWAASIYSISWLALVVNVGLGVFFLKPMADWSSEKQIFTFLIVEHALMALKMLVEIAIPNTDTLTHMISLTNKVVLEKLFSGDKGSRVMVQGSRQVPNMSLRYDPEAQHPSIISHQGLHFHGHDAGELGWLRAPDSSLQVYAQEFKDICGLSKRTKDMLDGHAGGLPFGPPVSTRSSSSRTHAE